MCVVGVCCRDFSVSLPQKNEALSGSCVIIKCTSEIREQYEKYLTEKATTRLWLKDGTEEDKHCAEQLTDVLTDIFNISLSQAVVPTCFKSTTITPVPKKSPVSCLNDYHPIALTPITMKCFERLVMRHIKSNLPNTLDPLQFAYRPNRSTDDAISSTLHQALTHLENKDSYVRMLFIDFSSAFNTIIPQQLINKLNLLGLNASLYLSQSVSATTPRALPH